ncbi:MAG: hypothetical protein ABJG78_03010 [Cyclobacteriaceae bacterium]
MKKFKLTIILVSIFISLESRSQTDWSTVDFSKEYKVDTKIQGAVAKSLKSNPTFINDYTIVQASLMKGASRAGTLQKQGVGSVFAEAALAGVSPDALQALISELYQGFVNELNSAGLSVTDGESLLQTKYVVGKKKDKKAIIGKTDGTYIYDKSGPMGGSIKEQYLFRPKNVNVFTKPGVMGANFYQNLASKEAVNLISIEYTIMFANFEGSKSGLSKNSLSTSAGLVIMPKIKLINPKGSFSWIVFEKNIDGNNDWSKGLIEKGSNDGSAFGLSSNADYAIEADQVKYIAELKSIILNLQKGIAKEIQATF